MAPKRGWCKHCLDDYRHGDIIVKCSSCPRSFHRECLDNDILAHATHSAYYQQNVDNPLDLSDFTCDSCLQYAQEAEIVNDERCKICKERNRDETDVLLLCDGCPNSYHMSCLNLQVEPDSDKWYCPMCKPEAFEGVNVRAQRRNPLTDAADHVNSSICYVCQRHGKLLGCDFCSNSFHYDCLPEFDIDTIADVWECPCCRGEDPFLNQMHKRWTVSQIEKNSRTRRKSILTWRGVITRYRNRFILAHRNELSSFVANKIIDQLIKSFISNKIKNKKDKYKIKDVENQLELLQEEQLIESNKFIIKARKSCYYPSGRKKDNRPMRTGVSLKPHQEDGVDWLLKSFLTGGAILADEMGLGKTIQTLCFLSYLKMMNIEGPHLIVVPLSTVGNWLREIHRFTPHLTVIKICGSKTERLHAMSDRLSYSGLYDLFVTTYETVKCEEAFFVETISRWQCLILDEAHRIKNQSGALRHSMDRIVSNMRLLLTGTPLQNNAQELFTLINFMFPDLFRDSQIMEQAFNAKKRLRNELEMNFTNQELNAIKLLLSKIMLRRLKEQAISLPKKIFHDIWLPLSQETLKWYRTLMNIKSLMNENMSIKKLLGIVIKMRIICGHPRGIVSRTQQLDKLYAFFKQEDNNIQKKVQNEANELQNLKGLSHIYASAKLTFLDKLLCQLHYENCRLVPNYHRSYQQHLKALDNSLYRKYTNIINSNNKEENIEGTDNKQGLKQQSILDSFNNQPTSKGLVKSEQDVVLNNLTNISLQVKSEKTLSDDVKSLKLKKTEEFLIKKEENINDKDNKQEKDNFDTKVDLSNLKLMSDNDNNNDKDKMDNDNMDIDNNENKDSNDNKKNNNKLKKDKKESNKHDDKLNNEDKDNKDKMDKDDDDENDNNKDDNDKSKQKVKKTKKKNKLTKEEVLSKVENQFIREPTSTSGSKLYLSDNLKEVNLKYNCPYVSMKIYENALEQEAKYKKDKKKSTYKFESTRLVDLVQDEQDNINNYINDPNKKSNKIIESDDDFQLDNNDDKDYNNNNENKLKTELKENDKENNIDMDNNENNDNKDDLNTEKHVKFEQGVLLMKQENQNKMDNDNVNNDNDKINNNNKQEKTEQYNDQKYNLLLKSENIKNEEHDNNNNNNNNNNNHLFNNPFDDEDDIDKNKIRMHKVLIFTQFQLVLDELETYCINRGWKYMRLDGSTNKLIRELDIREFNSNNSHYFVYLISTRAGGLGINLTAANHVVLYDEDWNPFIDLQAIDRAHRIGQKRDVHIWKLISEWTVEERMALIREKKLQLDKLILHGNENINNNMDNNNNNKEYNNKQEKTEQNNNEYKENKVKTEIKENNKQNNNKEKLKQDNIKQNQQIFNDKLLDEDDVIISLSHQAILKMMMHGNKALQHLECEQIIDKKLDEIIERKRKLPPEHLDDTNDIVDDILISKSNQLEGDDRVIIELVKEDELDIIQEETEKIKKKKVSGLLVKDLINEEDVIYNNNDNKQELIDIDEQVNEYNDIYSRELCNEGFVDDRENSVLNHTAAKYTNNNNNNNKNNNQNKQNNMDMDNNENKDNKYNNIDMDNKVDDNTITLYNENDELKPTRSRRSRFMVEMEQAGLLWRSVREKKKPNMIYTPVEWQKKGESRQLKHENKCFLCGKQKNYIAKYNDKDNNEVEVDYGDLVKCFRCPKSYHKFCERLNIIKRNWCCRWHECCLCFRKSSQCGNLLIHCSNCPTSFCYDCFPPDYTRHYVSDEYYYNLTQRGLMANTTNWIFFLCSKCKIESERKKRNISGEERDKHKKEQKELRSELLSSIKNKDKEGIKEKKRLKTLLNKQEKARIEELKTQELELEEKHRNLYQSLFPINMITELTNRINSDILNSNSNNTLGRPRTQDKTKVDKKQNNNKDKENSKEENENNKDNNNEEEKDNNNNEIKEQNKEISSEKEDNQNKEKLKQDKKTKLNKRKEDKEDKDNQDDNDKEEKEDEDWGVGLRARKRGLNFSNVKLPYKLLQFCDNCRIPLHNVYKNPMSCPYPKETVKLDLEINIRKSKNQITETSSEHISSSKNQQNNNEIGSSSTNSLELNIDNKNNNENKEKDKKIKQDKKTKDMKNNQDKTKVDKKQDNKKEENKDNNNKQEKLEENNKEDKENKEENEKKVIKKGYCSSCYDKKGIRSSHLRRHCEFLTEEEKNEYKYRNELVEKAMKILESLVSKTPNEIDYTQYSNLKLKSLYHHMLDQCDSLYFRALVDVGLLSVPKDHFLYQLDNKNISSNDIINTKLLEKNTRNKFSQLNHQQLHLETQEQYNNDNNNQLNTPLIIQNNIINNIIDKGTQLKEETYKSNVDNKGLADYVRSFNSIYRHRSNRDTLLLPIVYEDNNNNNKPK